MRGLSFLCLFVGAIVAAATVGPHKAPAQAPRAPLVGFLSTRSPAESVEHVAAFRRGLAQTGHVEGRNIVIEYRWSEGHNDRLPNLAADLVRQNVAVLATAGGSLSGLAAKRATSTIPIVFISTIPVKLGLVSKVNRPGGNITGIDVLLQEMEGKRLSLLRELVPDAALIAVLMNPSSPAFGIQLKDVEESARRLGQRIRILHATSQQDIDSAFTTLADMKPAALLVTAAAFFNSRREQIITLANHYKIPAIYEVREFALAGGLMSYGTSLLDGYRQLGIYTGRILAGEKPGELPVFQIAKFEFVINLKTARALGIKVPGSLSARADEIIE